MQFCFSFIHSNLGNFPSLKGCSNYEKYCSKLIFCAQITKIGTDFGLKLASFSFIERVHTQIKSVPRFLHNSVDIGDKYVHLLLNLHIDLSQLYLEECRV